MRRYYFIDSSGEDTNLQLYSLKQAKLYWTALEHDVSESKEVAHLHERCVFVICTIGLSVSQLLGQNNPEPTNGVPSPTTIFKSIVTKHRLDLSLIDQFRDFIDCYDHCRHFGLTRDGTRHSQVGQVTLDKTRELYNFGLLVWSTIIEVFRREPGSELEDFDLDQIENEP